MCKQSYFLSCLFEVQIKVVSVSHAKRKTSGSVCGPTLQGKKKVMDVTAPALTNRVWILVFLYK